MVSGPPRSTRTDTRFPYTTLCRSRSAPSARTPKAASRSCRYSLLEALQVAGLLAVLARGGGARGGRTDRTQRRVFRTAETESEGAALPVGAARSEERRGGKECVSTSRAGGSTYTYNTNDKTL